MLFNQTNGCLYCVSWFEVKLMGRESGFIALHSALANSDVNLLLIPEVPFSIEKVLQLVERRLQERYEKRERERIRNKNNNLKMTSKRLKRHICFSLSLTHSCILYVYNMFRSHCVIVVSEGAGEEYVGVQGICFPSLSLFS